ncbi:uncharacterized protein PGTG_10239 [Puccinia graminis f. sp. tritici CRL 75-36-700-3]|uniref:Uncharacterized protein n=1 Tax=Puccinia graminis f. sp. tritici (strain CRL 75-36-700-3 / race SCCL) TaxID=418459 RepID=E3KJP4_PUCGT|nr:uncharacterized protein PGTG_10239 [Puccinia graminis f. sp. tritici CRL 75-36-700-3]EFP84519.1 hypothetical protein PGTG_10239 [Puccinia graminis f. sp. tritici CRL 75-36-700-3]
MATEIVRESKILLNNDNYALWLLPMKAKLHKAKSLTIVTGIHTYAYAEIVQHLNQEVLAYVSSTQTETDEFNGYKLWQLLKQKYAGNDLTSRTTALKKYLAVEYDSFSAFLPLIRSANQKIVLSKLALDDQVKTILMLDKLPPEFHSFKTNISMNFETESFEEVLKKLEDFAAQNQLNELKKRSTSPISSQATMYTRSSDPDISGHTEDSCYQKHPEKRAPKSVASSSKQHSSHLTRYTQEDKEYLQQKYPDLHL